MGDGGDGEAMGPDGDGDEHRLGDNMRITMGGLG